jgi:hypothetical protein
VTIEQVLGPNQYGFYDVVAQGRKHSTKLPELVQIASALVGQMAVITFETVQNQAADGRVFTNHRLKKVAPFDGPMNPPMVQQPPLGAQPQPTPVVPGVLGGMPGGVSGAPAASEGYLSAKDRQVSIEKQTALKLAGELSGFKVEVTTVDQLLSLAEAIFAHLQRTWPAEQGDVKQPYDDIPY